MTFALIKPWNQPVLRKNCVTEVKLKSDCLVITFVNNATLIHANSASIG